MKKKLMVGAVITALALVPVSAYAANGLNNESTKLDGLKMDGHKVTSSISFHSSVDVTGPGNAGKAGKATIGFAGGYPPKEELTRMITELKDNLAETGETSFDIHYIDSTGKEQQLTLSLDDSADNIVAKLLEKLQAAGLTEAPALEGGQRQSFRVSNGQAHSTFKSGVRVDKEKGGAIEITFEGGLPPKELLTDMIERLKSEAAESGDYTALVSCVDDSGQSATVKISLKDATDQVIADLQAKFKEAELPDMPPAGAEGPIEAPGANAVETQALSLS